MKKYIITKNMLKSELKNPILVSVTDDDLRIALHAIESEPSNLGSPVMINLRINPDTTIVFHVNNTLYNLFVKSGMREPQEFKFNLIDVVGGAHEIWKLDICEDKSVDHRSFYNSPILSLFDISDEIYFEGLDGSRASEVEIV